MKTLWKNNWDILYLIKHLVQIYTISLSFFGSLQELLEGTKFNSKEEVIDSVQEWVKMQSKDFYFSVIKKPSGHWNNGRGLHRKIVHRSINNCNNENFVVRGVFRK